jgi:integrase
VLNEWRQQMTSLRQVARDHVQAAASSRYGEDTHRFMVARRSIFRALKQERLIFANPCAEISVTRSPALPVGLPQDRLAGLLDRVSGPMARFVIALAAIHALRPDELRALKLADLDLVRARLTVRRRRVLAPHFEQAHRKPDHRPHVAVPADQFNAGMTAVPPRQLNGLHIRPAHIDALVVHSARRISPPALKLFFAAPVKWSNTIAPPGTVFSRTTSRAALAGV